MTHRWPTPDLENQKLVEKINKINKCLAKLAKKKDTITIKNKIIHTSTDPTDIRKGNRVI